MWPTTLPRFDLQFLLVFVIACAVSNVPVAYSVISFFIAEYC